MGCIPQIMLIAFDYHRKVPGWSFIGISQDSNALIKYPNGNIIFSISTLSVYLFLLTIFFGWDRLFKNDGFLCTLCKTICRPFPNPCSSSIPEELDPSITSNQDDPKKIKQTGSRILEPLILSRIQTMRKEDNQHNDLSISNDVENLQGDYTERQTGIHLSPMASNQESGCIQNRGK